MPRQRRIEYPVILIGWERPQGALECGSAAAALQPFSYQMIQ